MGCAVTSDRGYIYLQRCQVSLPPPVAAILTALGAASQPGAHGQPASLAESSPLPSVRGDPRRDKAPVDIIVVEVRSHSLLYSVDSNESFQ
jgi:hypothetical protein